MGEKGVLRAVQLPGAKLWLCIIGYFSARSIARLLVKAAIIRPLNQ